MKRRKHSRLLAMLLTCAMLLSMLPSVAFAEESVDVSDTPMVTEESTEDDAKDEVTVLEEGLCGENATWKVVRDGDGVVSLTVSGSGEMTDYAKTSETPWYSTYIKTAKTDRQVSAIVIEEGITHIGSFAFIFGGVYDSEECAVTSIMLPDSLKSIGDSGIAGFGELESITLPDNLEKIGDNVFSGCAFTNITIGRNLTEIGTGAFASCSQLKAITVAVGNSKYMANDGVLFSLDQTSLLVYPAGKTGDDYTIPDSVTEIKGNAFKGSQLKTLTLGKNVETIGDSAFANCQYMNVLNADGQNNNYTSDEGVLFNKDETTIIFYPNAKTDGTYALPTTVTKVGASAFANNTYLETVTLPDGLTELGDAAFSGCSSLNSVTLPEGLTTIGKSVFSNCSSLKNIALPASVTTVDAWAFIGLAEDSVVFGANQEVIALVLDNSYERYTKSNTALAVLEGGSISGQISASGLIDCTPVKSGYLFYGWYADAEHTQAVTSTSAGNTYYAAWTTVRLKQSRINAAVDAEITLEVEREDDTRELTWTSSDTSIATVKNGVVKTIAPGTVTITVTDGITSDFCTIIVREKGIVIEEGSLELSIRDENKKSATLTTVLTGVEGTVSWESSDSSVASVDDNGTVTAIAVGTATITASVEGYSDTCEITVDDGGTLGDKANVAWKYDPATKTLTIMGTGSMGTFGNPESSSATNIAPWYTYHKDIENIVIESGITTVATNFARGCTAVQKVTIPDTVTSIGNYAFAKCSSLQGVTLPEGITTLNQQCFQGCTSLKVVYLKGSCQSIESKAFYNLATDSVIYTVDQTTAEALYGKYTSKNTAIAVLNDGSFEDVPTSSESLAKPIKDGYTFAGWYEDSSFSGDSVTSATAGNTYYAKWTENIAKFYGASLTLDGTIGVNFYVDMTDVSAANMGNYSVKFTVNNEDTTVNIADAKTRVMGGTTYYVFTCSVAAKQMTDNITAQLCNGTNNVVETKEYSVKKYCDYSLKEGSTASDELKALLTAMLQYGAYAQMVFNYKTKDLATSLEGVDLSNVTAETLSAYAYKTTGDLPGEVTVGATLVLESSTTIRFYVGGNDVNDYTYQVDGKAVEMKSTNNYDINPADYTCYADVENIGVRQLGTAHTFAIVNSSGETVYSISYSALSYAYNTLNVTNASNATSENLSNLVKAMYLYFDAAQTYTGWKN